MKPLGCLVLAMLTYASFTPPALSFPTVTEPVQLDHGFRYHDGADRADGCALTMDGERLLATYRASDGDGITASRKTHTGGEVDIAPICVVGGG